MINPESISYLFEVGHKGKQEDYIWPVPGTATGYDRVFIVCDGAGRFDNGEIASNLICQFMAQKILMFGEHKMSGDLINKLLIEARDRLVTYAREYRLDTDLATTFSMVVLYDQKVLISWFGDSRIYHVRDGEILYKTEDSSVVHELMPLDEESGESNVSQIQNASVSHGISADSSVIESETRWLEDVQDGDYFMLCSKSILENVSDDDIKGLLTQNNSANTDLADSFKQLVSPNTSDNYSMYLVRVNRGTQKRTGKSNGTTIEKKRVRKRERERKERRGVGTPIIILSITIIGLLILFLFFKKSRTSGTPTEYVRQTTQPVDALRHDSVPAAINKSARASATPATKDSVKAKTENTPPTTKVVTKDEEDDAVQVVEKPAPIIRTPVNDKKSNAQLRIKLTTDESCKLTITNTDLGDVIDWDLAQNDNGTIYLKPGKYSIVATSVINSSKTKTYNFEVKPADTHSTQNVHIAF